MAEFQEMVREFHRLCETQRRLHNNICDKCPIKVATMGTMFQCYRYVLEKPEKAENIIVAWAAEHPEPVYPTWAEWFIEHGDLVDGWQNATNATWMANTALSVFMEPIPADIASKLGIQPKEAKE